LNYLELLNGCKKYIDQEPRDFIYKIATRIVEQCWPDPSQVSEGIATFLLSWNIGYYRYGSLDVDKLQNCIQKWHRELESYRGKYIMGLTEEDEDRVKEIFRDFEIATRRVGRRQAKAPVSAAKALHLLAPNFFPLWDNAIAKAYDCGKMNQEDYVRFMRKMREQIQEVLKSYIEKHGGKEDEAIRAIWDLYPHKIPEKEGKLLKLIDEYNYAKYTIPCLKISQRLREYPNIKKLFKEQYFHDQILNKKEEEWHPLVHLLLKQKPDYTEIEKLITRLKESEDRFKKITQD
jgi:hypothetical protein